MDGMQSGQPDAEVSAWATVPEHPAIAQAGDLQRDYEARRVAARAATRAREAAAKAKDSKR